MWDFFSTEFTPFLPGFLFGNPDAIINSEGIMSDDLRLSNV